ncbi:Oidioi.mRNA.OKI2018_I69.chr1.g303.t1.cds [Oikopleura dioica]|uniref:Oidioi.mRNA.OKI2018_I69.chr1.g303.t1.cds n=1 Tax=Oikopleura dioica TaxID=34765 RepID=A0ABN7SNV3_OIKDI|nr:Oidioi.mRNA.OKI2018_I69.chr1.g303.t1.cds [Oikopleura dioica]
MCREEIEGFTSEITQKSEDIFSSLVSSHQSSPSSTQTVVFSIHTVKQEGGLESGITVRHMAEFYEKFFEYQDWEILSYKEVPYGGSNTKTQGDPMELVQFTVQGEGALEILAREKGIHQHKRQSFNTKIGINLKFSVAVHCRPLITKEKRSKEEIKRDLRVISTRGIRGGNADGGVRIRLNLHDPVYGLHLTYDGVGNKQQNMNEAVDVMKKRIRELEERDFQNTKAELENDISQKIVRIYDHTTNKVTSASTSTVLLSDFLTDFELLSEIHEEQKEEETKALLNDFLCEIEQL